MYRFTPEVAGSGGDGREVRGEVGDGWGDVVGRVCLFEVPFLSESTSGDRPAAPQVSWSCLSHLQFHSLGEGRGREGGRRQMEVGREEETDGKEEEREQEMEKGRGGGKQTTH